MTAQNFIVRILTVCTVAGAALLAVPAGAEPAQAASEAKPLKLNSYMRKPVASSATRTVKKKDGEYAKVAVKRRAKARTASRSVIMPQDISPAAAQAFAAYELARVRVVTPEEAHSTLLLADAAANATRVLAVDSVQVVSAGEVNEIDRKADTPYAISLDALSRDLAGSREVVYPTLPKTESDTWLQRILMVFGSAFAGVATLVRILLG